MPSHDMSGETFQATYSGPAKLPTVVHGVPWLPVPPCPVPPVPLWLAPEPPVPPLLTCSTLVPPQPLAPSPARLAPARAHPTSPPTTARRNAIQEGYCARSALARNARPARLVRMPRGC